MTCIVCGPTQSPRSNEHVFPQWLLNFLNAKRLRISIVRRKGDGSTEPHRREIELDSFRLNRICETCNNGWMSDLESQSKPLLEGLLKQTVTLGSLDRDERRILARWTGKTAIIESHASGAECPVERGLLQWMKLREDGTPGRFAVVGHSSSIEAVGHFQTGVIRDLIGGGTISGSIVSIVLPRLILVSLFPMPKLDYKCRCNLSLFEPMWPDAPAWDMIGNAPKFTPEVNPGQETVLSLMEQVELFHSIV